MSSRADRSRWSSAMETKGSKKIVLRFFNGTEKVPVTTVLRRQVSMNSDKATFTDFQGSVKKTKSKSNVLFERQFNSKKGPMF